LEICQKNECGFYDHKGVSEKVLLKGQPACAGCGCNAKFKTHCLSCHCYLKDIGKVPLWGAVMTEEEEDNFRKKTGIKNV
jgi:hypothetical protein